MKHLSMLTVVTLLLLGGCANDKSASIALLNALAGAAKQCGGEPGCIATVNAAFYSGALGQNEDSTTRIIGATVPLLNVGLELTRIIMGGSGNGQGGGFVLNRSHGNTFILNKSYADRSSKVDSPFSMTTTNSQTYENMYNPVTDNSRDQVVK